ncbi:unnamed protein product [Phyllotreta striolata]|uniref:O-acyltransferase WSD1 C-terminal domain-containing protein n=1 Tax=Phyllotreta striolata TaxID=444603 RepID=A0A9N9XSV4_PHYSR|nr:unnamed protein product [Phyllotreta striolata]
MAITVMIILSLKNNDFPTFVEAIKNRITTEILSKSKAFPKLTSTFHRVLGYGYFLKTTLKAEELVSTIKIEKNNEYYAKTHDEIFAEFSTRDLPRKNTVTWEMIIIDAPASWKLKENFTENQVVMIVRMHHGVGDGIAVTNLLVKLLSSEPIDFIKHAAESMKKRPAPKRLPISEHLYQLHLFLLTPGYILWNKLVNKSRKKAFKSPAVSRKRAFYTGSDLDGSLVQTVKRIKGKVGDSAFLEIMLTAVSKSLNNYFDKTNQRAPDKILQLVPFMATMPSSAEDSKLLNTFSLLHFPLPVALKSDSFVSRLNKVKEYSRYSRNLIDIQARQFFWNYLNQILPVHLYFLLENFDNTIIIVSNIPGCPKLSIWDNEVDHVYFVPPQLNTGIVYTFFTYDDKLQICVGFDENVLKFVEHSSKIAQDVFGAIKDFDEEVNGEKMKILGLNVS